MFTGMKIVSSIFAYSYFLFLQLLFLHDKINLSSLKSFSKGEEQKFLPNVSRENPLEQPRLQNSIWHTKLRVELSFFGLMVLHTWHLAKFVPWQYWNYINFHNSISWFRSFNACLLYILRAGPRPTKGKIRSNCDPIFCTVTKKYKVHVENWKFKSAINSIGKLLHALLSIFFSKNC